MARKVAAFLALGILSTSAWAQSPSNSPVERMSCEELVQLRSNRARWERISRFRASTDLGWTLQSNRLAVIDNSNQLAKVEESTRSIEADVDIAYVIGAAILPMNNMATGTDPEPLRYSWRWLFSKPAVYKGKLGRCSEESSGEAQPSKQIVISIKLTNLNDLDLGYTLFLYDERKNILYTGEFLTHPKIAKDRQRQSPGASESAIKPRQESDAGKSDADDDAANLRSAYQAVTFLERCDDFGVTTVAPSTNRARLAKIEQSAAAMKVDLQASKRTALEKMKSQLDMFDMFAALGPLNYQQRDTLQQFCALQGMMLLQVSKQFAERDQAAAR